MSRHCTILLVKNGEYYLELAHEEHADRDQADLFGPFDSEKAVEKYLFDNFCNPGGLDFDTADETPLQAPNGTKIQSPKRNRGW